MGDPSQNQLFCALLQICNISTRGDMTRCVVYFSPCAWAECILSPWCNTPILKVLPSTLHKGATLDAAISICHATVFSTINAFMFYAQLLAMLAGRTPSLLSGHSRRQTFLSTWTVASTSMPLRIRLLMERALCPHGPTAWTMMRSTRCHRTSLTWPISGEGLSHGNWNVQMSASSYSVML